MGREGFRFIIQYFRISAKPTPPIGMKLSKIAFCFAVWIRLRNELNRMNGYLQEERLCRKRDRFYVPVFEDRFFNRFEKWVDFSVWSRVKN